MKGDEFSGPHFDVSKELEIINFKVLHGNRLDDGTRYGKTSEKRATNTKHWISDENKLDGDDKNIAKDQFTSFQKATRVLIVCGQCIGLNPVTGIRQDEPSKMRFTVYSWKFLFSLTMVIVQSIGTALSYYRLFKNPVSVGALGFVTFFTTACSTTIIFIWIASKWPTLMQELIKSKLDDYIDPNVSKKCHIACGIFMGMAVMEHTMSVLSRVARIYECSSTVNGAGEIFLKATSPWLYDLNIPYVEAVGIIVQLLNTITTAAWNYADIFIVCISLFFTSILQQINKKIALTASKHYVTATTWGVLRADYTRATNLVKQFDDVFSGVVLVSTANDLFFICLQLYNVFANGVKSAHRLCPGLQNSVFQTYVYPTYLTCSTLYLCVRFLTVALVAAGVHSASMLPAPMLYTVPATSYSKEVERFHTQVNSDVVALSGLGFFYVTRELVLTVAGTIVTYELVLLQFSSEDLSKS